MKINYEIEMKEIFITKLHQFLILVAIALILIPINELKAQAPGGVSNGLKLWLKADTGTSSTNNNTKISQWKDFSGLSHHGNMANTNNQPKFRNNFTDNINYNPSIYYNGTDFLYHIGGMLDRVQYNAAATFIVSKNQTLTQNNFMFFQSDSDKSVAIQLPWSNNQAYWFGNYNSYIQTSFNSSVNVPQIWTGWNSNLKSPICELFREGVQVATGNNTVSYRGADSNLYIGGRGPFNIPNSYLGVIGEIIYYTSDLSLTDKLKIETYLAIKYGIKLTQTSGENYISTNGTIIWNNNLNSSFNNNVAGIGRDDAEGLNQKVSSARDANFVSIGLQKLSNTNRASIFNFTTNGSYLIWGDNNGSSKFVGNISNNAPGGRTDLKRMLRVWKAQKTGTVDTLQIAIKGSYIPSSSKYLVVSSDSTFSSGNIWYSLDTLTHLGSIYYQARLKLNTGQYFTFANESLLPGGVDRACIWLRSNEATNTTLPNNTTLNKWVNQAYAGDALMSTTSKRPTFKNNSTDNINFNPTILFDGVDDCFQIGPHASFNGTISAFSVHNTTSNTGTKVALSSYNTAAFKGWNFRITNLNRTLSTGTGTSFTNLSAGSSTQGVYEIIGFKADTGISKPQSVTLNNKQVASASNTYVSNNTTVNFSVGSNATTSGFFKGYISEQIVFDTTLSNLETQRVGTYLAIKYGIGMDQSTPKHYLATDGSIIWNANFNNSFKNHLVGIGRDDIEGLRQVQSKSIDAGNQLLMGLSIQSSIIQNASNFPSNISYIVCGDNNLSESITTNLSNGKRMARVWKAQTQNYTGTVRVSYPATAFSSLADMYLITSADSSFSGTFTRTALNQFTLPGTSTVYYYADVQLQNGQFFTFAEVSCEPTLASTNTRSEVHSSGICQIDNWLYYKHPSNSAISLVAIDPNGNTWNPDSVIVDNLSAGTYSATDMINTTALGKRMLTIIAPGTYTTNGGIKIRFYYDPSDWTGLPLTTQQWFKHPGEKSDVLADLTPTGLANCDILTPAATGIENGVHYVEFHNITSFSTFGFGGTTNINALPIKLISFSAQALNETSADINWSFYTDEQKPITFTLQSSANGNLWNDIAVFENEGKTGILKYNYIDNNPFHPITFYKLKFHAADNEPFESNKLFVNWNSATDNSRLYPNPNTGTLTIELSNSTMYESNSIEIVNAQGEVVKTFSHLTSNLITLNIEDLSDGLYWIRVINDSGNTLWSNKFMLNH